MLTVSSECPSCGAAVATPYCGVCGERRAADHPRSLRALADEAWDVFSPVDGRIARTLWTLVARPGALVVEYMRGARRRYVPPLRLFVVVNVIFFLYASFVGNRMFDTPLSSHLNSTPYRGLARRTLARRVPPQQGESADRYEERLLSSYAPRFNRASTAQAKSLVIIMVPMFAVFVALVEWRRRPHLLQDVVLAFHTIAALLLFVIALPWLIGLPLKWLIVRSGIRISEEGDDTLFGVLILAALGTWSFVALRRAYGDRRMAAAIKAALLTFGIACTLSAYRAVLFFTTLYATR